MSSKTVDHGLVKPKAKRKRPPVTHRDVSHLAPLERASAPQNAPGTVPHRIAFGKGSRVSRRR